ELASPFARFSDHLSAVLSCWRENCPFKAGSCLWSCLYVQPSHPYAQIPCYPPSHTPRNQPPVGGGHEAWTRRKAQRRQQGSGARVRNDSWSLLAKNAAVAKVDSSCHRSTRSTSRPGASGTDCRRHTAAVAPLD